MHASCRREGPTPAHADAGGGRHNNSPRELPETCPACKKPKKHQGIPQTGSERTSCVPRSVTTSISHTKHTSNVPARVPLLLGAVSCQPRAGSLAKRQGERPRLRRRHAPRPDPGEWRPQSFPLDSVFVLQGVFFFLFSGRPDDSTLIACHTKSTKRRTSKFEPVCL